MKLRLFEHSITGYTLKISVEYGDKVQALSFSLDKFYDWLKANHRLSWIEDSSNQYGEHVQTSGEIEDYFTEMSFDDIEEDILKFINTQSIWKGQQLIAARGRVHEYLISNLSPEKEKLCKVG